MLILCINFVVLYIHGIAYFCMIWFISVKNITYLIKPKFKIISGKFLSVSFFYLRITDHKNSTGKNAGKYRIQGMLIIDGWEKR